MKICVRLVIILICSLFINHSFASQDYTAETLADKIIELYRNNGQVFYNHNATEAELVTEVAHALQTAHFAQTHKLVVGNQDSFIGACLLHEIGHLLFSDFRSTDQNDHHDEIGGEFLDPIFGKEVSEPVRLHVLAKRYLCTIDPKYFSKLTAASQRSFVKQGKKLSPQVIAEFEHTPFHKVAIEVRKLDDQAKVAGMKTVEFSYYRPLLISLARKHLGSLPEFDRQQVIKKAMDQIDNAILTRKAKGHSN